MTYVYNRLRKLTALKEDGSKLLGVQPALHLRNSHARDSFLESLFYFFTDMVHNNMSVHIHVLQY